MCEFGLFAFFCFSDDLLKAIDAEAAGSRISRSALIQAALKGFLEARRREREEAERRRGMEEACRGMDTLAEKLGSWDPVKVIREFRESRVLRVREPRKRYRAANRKRRS